MNKEINKIIANLEGCFGIFDYSLTPTESNLLASYIKKLQQENKILKENAEHNDKVVDEVNWQNVLLKIKYDALKEIIDRVLDYIDSQTRNMPKNGCHQRLSRIRKMLKEVSE